MAEVLHDGAWLVALLELMSQVLFSNLSTLVITATFSASTGPARYANLAMDGFRHIHCPFIFQCLICAIGSFFRPSSLLSDVGTLDAYELQVFLLVGITEQVPDVQILQRDDGRITLYYPWWRGSFAPSNAHIKGAVVLIAVSP